jgi:hypothetical protein
MDERERREVVIRGPLVIEGERSGGQAGNERKRRVSKARKKKNRVKEIDNGNDQRPDLRDFIERVIRTFVSGAFLIYCCCLGFLPRRSLYLFIPLGLAFYAGFILVGKRVYANSEKRIRKGKRYKFMDVDNESEWIFWLTKLGMIGAMFLLGWLWATNNLKHYWYLTAFVPMLMFICIIFTPETGEPGDGGVDF